MIKFTQVHIVLYFAKTWLFSRIWAKCPLQHNWNSHFTRYCFQLLNVLAVLSFDAVFFFYFTLGMGSTEALWAQVHFLKDHVFSLYFFLELLLMFISVPMSMSLPTCMSVSISVYVWDPHATCACLSLTHVLFPLQ